MRKRLVIGAIAAVVIGVAAFVLSQPKEGTVEWHKRKCEREMLRLGGKKTLFDRARNIVGYPPRPNRYKEHLNALLAAGYLQRRDFILTNSQEKPARALVRWANKELPEHSLWTIQFDSNSVIRICAERHHMHKWEQAIREIDVPKSGK